MAFDEFARALKEWVGKFRVMFKLGVVGVLSLLLLIPLSMIESVLQERLERRKEAVREITSSWGQAQGLVGPILSIPYRQRTKVLRERKAGDRVEQVEVEEVTVLRAFFLPQTLAIEGKIEPRKLYRGIYDAVVYAGTLTLSGMFAEPAWAELKVDAKDVVWEDAVLTLGVTDLRGTREQIRVSFGSETFPMTPGTRLAYPANGVAASLPGVDWTKGPFPFSVALTFNGSGHLLFVPLGVDNRVSLTSPWPDPGFRGAFLPTNREISARGFTADWNVSYYGRSYPQQWTERNAVTGEVIGRSAFGVEFVSLIDFYRSVERATKYGFLFIVLIFTAFFLFELLARLPIHPFQYVLVGAAICIFYLGLLSLSEFLRFGLAYGLAAGASWAMISLYSWSVLKSGRRTGMIAGLLAVIYGVLYVLLQLQDFALLVGTIALFVALGAVMFVTRKVDWYGGRETDEPSRSVGNS